MPSIDAPPPAARGHPARRPGGSTARLMRQRLGFSGATGTEGNAWRVLQDRQFLRYFTGSVISNFGTWLQNTAQLLLAYQLTHSVFTVGLVTCAQFACPLLLGPWAGVLADRLGARRILIAAQVLSMAVAATLAILEQAHVLTEPGLLGGAFATGLLFTFALPAQSVIIPALVPSADRTKAAMAMNTVSYNAGRMVAPAFSVVVVATIGFTWAFAANSVSFGIFALILRTVCPQDGLRPAHRSRVRDGFRIAWDERKIAILLLMVAAITVADDPVLVLGPALAHHVFGMSDDWSGYFLSALGAGTVLGSLLPRRQAPSARRAATALALLGLSVMGYALAPWIWVSIVAAFAAGVSGLVAGSAAQAMLVELAGPERALRVMGLWTVAWAGTKPIASIIDGTLATAINLRLTGVILAAPALVPILMLVLCPAVVERSVARHSRGTAPGLTLAGPAVAVPQGLTDLVSDGPRP